MIFVEYVVKREIIHAWLSFLPIKGDLIEAKGADKLLCSLTERQDMELLGPNNRYVPKFFVLVIFHQDSFLVKR
ncbi:putative armadillo-like helical protein [Helianthus anomalus]